MAKLMAGVVFLAAFLCVSCSNQHHSSLMTGPSIEDLSAAVGGGSDRNNFNGIGEVGTIIDGTNTITVTGDSSSGTGLPH